MTKEHYYVVDVKLVIAVPDAILLHTAYQADTINEMLRGLQRSYTPGSALLDYQIITSDELGPHVEDYKEGDAFREPGVTRPPRLTLDQRLYIDTGGLMGTADPGGELEPLLAEDCTAGLLQGEGASEDHETFLAALRAGGLSEATAKEVHRRTMTHPDAPNMKKAT